MVGTVKAIKKMIERMELTTNETQVCLAVLKLKVKELQDEIIDSSHGINISKKSFDD